MQKLIQGDPFKKNIFITMKIIKLNVDDTLLENGFDFVALVNKPAIEKNFHAFKEYTEDEILEMILMDIMNDIPKKQIFSFIDEKQILVGPLMIPDKLIFRIDEETKEPFHVYFDEVGIRKIAYKMMKEKKLDKVNLEHNENQVVDDVYMIESWIIEDPKADKANKFGYDLPKGTWMASYKVDNQEIWDSIKKGNIKGFSIEGYFYE